MSGRPRVYIALVGINVRKYRPAIRIAAEQAGALRGVKVVVAPPADSGRCQGVISVKPISGAPEDGLTLVRLNGLAPGQTATGEFLRAMLRAVDRIQARQALAGMSI